MLNYFEVATILGPGWTTLDAQQAHEQLEEGFMVPDAGHFDADPEGSEGGPGLYARLSAPGYMDCTEWSGPFQTYEEALAHLISAYGKD